LIVLHPLSGAETEGLIESRLGGARLPSEALARLTDVVEGNPLPAEETLRMLVDDGRLGREAAPTTVQRCWTGVWTTLACFVTVPCRGCPAFPTASPPTPNGGHTCTPDHTWSPSSPTRSASTPQVKRRPLRPSSTLSYQPN
jgi:hypothetical protein